MATPWILAVALGLVSAGALVGESSPLPQDPKTPPAGVERPWREVAAQPFGNQIGSVTFARYLEGELLVTGSVYIGPAVAVEAASDLHAAGDRVVPVSYFSLAVLNERCLSQQDAMHYRAATSTEPFTLAIRHEEVSAEVFLPPRGELTWEEVRHEDDLLITVTGAVLPSKR